MIYPTKFVNWKEIWEWSWLLARKIKESWSPDVIVSVGRGGFVVSRLLCDFLDAENLIAVPIKWYELERRRGERYLADLIRAFFRATEGRASPDEGIAEVVRNLKTGVAVKLEANLEGQRALLVEEIVATGMHLKMAKEIVKEKWGAEEVKTATLVWKAPTANVIPDYYVIRPGKFVWFQFPWSRLSDYVQFLRVMLLEESRREGKLVWSEEEVEEKFKIWYGAKPETRFFKEALNILEKDGIVKLLSEGKISVASII